MFQFFLQNMKKVIFLQGFDDQNSPYVPQNGWKLGVPQKLRAPRKFDNQNIWSSSDSIPMQQAHMAIRMSLDGDWIFWIANGLLDSWWLKKQTIKL
jgi:hypothetical protein